MSEIKFQKDWFPVFKVKVTVKDHLIKIWLPNICIFWTADLFATKLGFMAQCHKLDCLVKRLECCIVVKVTGKVHISSKCSYGWYNLNCWTFLSKLVWWCIIMGQGVMQEDLFAVFKFKVTVRVHVIDIQLFLQYALNCWSFCNQI